ncbi:sulfotransferase domain-containing protein [Alteraurantiacibacter aestuarii]|uniref:sulfotransferase domain-containing protein n=1 Tax=Alteraurantiacibacter aestuarii TaxID=650004 RepID=UPI0031D00BBE
MTAGPQTPDARAHFAPGQSIVWLASYPKSGNTWLRALLTAYLYPEQKFDLNRLVGRPVAFERQVLDDHAAINSAEYTPEELLPFQAMLHRELGRTLPAPSFIKVHSEYICSADGSALFPAMASAGAVCITRHPFDVAPSFAHHLGCSLDEAIAIMADDDALLDHREDGGSSNVPQRLGSWSGHAHSWLSQSEIPVLHMRYEDLLDDTAGQFSRLLGFCGISPNPAQLAHAVESTRFGRLQRLEAEGGFSEKPSAGRAFFRQGRSRSGQTGLTSRQTQEIRNSHESMMGRLGYSFS